MQLVLVAHRNITCSTHNMQRVHVKLAVESIKVNRGTHSAVVLHSTHEAFDPQLDNSD